MTESTLKQKYSLEELIELAKSKGIEVKDDDNKSTLAAAIIAKESVTETPADETKSEAKPEISEPSEETSTETLGVPNGKRFDSAPGEPYMPEGSLSGGLYGLGDDTTQPYDGPPFPLSDTVGGGVPDGKGFDSFKMGDEVKGDCISVPRQKIKDFEVGIAKSISEAPTVEIRQLLEAKLDTMKEIFGDLLD